jgi:trigger factor
MKTELTELSSTRRRLTVEVPAADVAATFQDLLREHRKRVQLPGFRPGKAPLEVVRQRLGGELGHEAAERLLEAFAREAVRREGLEPVDGGVTVELAEGHDHIEPAKENEPYAFALAVDVVPAIDPHDYVGRAIARPAVEVTDEELEAELKAFRERQGKLIPVTDRGSLMGDYLAVDMEGAELGQAPVIARKPRVIRLGEEGNLPEFDQKLQDMKAGDDFAFSVSYPADHPTEQLKGKTIFYKGKVNEIRRPEIPPLDDELAQTAGAESVADLKEKIREAIHRVKSGEADAVARQRLLEDLLSLHPFEAPESLVRQELKDRLEDLGRGLAMRGIDPDKVQLDWNKILERERGAAEGSVRARLLLDAIAKKEGVSLEQGELDREIELLARETGVAVADARARLAQAGNLAGLERDILRRKSLDWLYSQAKIS